MDDPELQLALFEPPTPVPAWRLAMDGGPLLVHDPRCMLDPNHHRLCPCVWPATPDEARHILYERLLRRCVGVLPAGPL